MSPKTNIYLDTELKRAAKIKAAAVGISLSQYIRNLLQQDLKTKGEA